MVHAILQSGGTPVSIVASEGQSLLIGIKNSQHRGFLARENFAVFSNFIFVQNHVRDPIFDWELAPCVWAD
jgi:hypothetical protein